jgi:hypothetical protein
MTQTKAFDTNAIQPYDNRGNPLVAMDATLEIALGNIPGRTHERKFGFNDNLGNVAFETVWAPAGRVQFLSTGEIMSIVSTDVNDIAGGTGSRAVAIIGVDENFELMTEIVVLNGTTPVLTLNKFWVINRMIHVSAGSNKLNHGDIDATATITGTLQARTPAGYGSTQQVFVAMPVGFGSVVWTFDLIGTKLAGGAKPLITARVYLHELLDNEGMQTIVFEEAFDTGVTNRTSDGTIRGQIVGQGQVVELTALSDTLNSGVYSRAAYTQVENSQRI